MKRNSYPLISTPEFRKIKTQKEFVPTEDSPIITTENKNGEENSSFFFSAKIIAPTVKLINVVPRKKALVQIKILKKLLRTY